MGLRSSLEEGVKPLIMKRVTEITFFNFFFFNFQLHQKIKTTTNMFVLN